MTSRTKIQWHGAEFTNNIEQALHRRMSSVGAWLRREVVASLTPAGGVGTPSGPAGSPPHSRTGQLRQSIQWAIGESRGRIFLQIFSTALYARVHELGGVITPTTAKALAVPISDAAKRHAGSPLTFGRELVMIQRPGRPPVLVEQNQRVVRVHYVLPPLVRIPARPFLRPVIDDNWREIRRRLTHRISLPRGRGTGFRRGRA